MRDLFKFISVPFGLLIFMAILLTVWRFFELPTLTEITGFAQNSLREYGYLVIFIAALAEGILLANWYLPGSVVVTMGVVLAQESGLHPLLTVAVITVAFLITSILNYLLGRYGWYRLLLRFGLKGALESTKARVEKHGLKIIFGTYFHPNVGALTATSIGILQMPFRKFFWYSLAALSAWNTLWGLVAYFTGPKILKIITFQAVIAVLALWVVTLGLVFGIRKYRQRISQSVSGAQERI